MPFNMLGGKNMALCEMAETKSANIFFVQNFIYNLPILKGILQWGFTKYVQQNVQQFEWAFVEIKASN